MITFSRDRDCRPPRVWLIVGWGVRSIQCARKSLCGRTAARRRKGVGDRGIRRGTRSWTGLKTLLVAAACVAGVIGISGIYPQIMGA